MFDKGEEKEMAAFMNGLWMNLTSDQVWQWWSSWCPVDGLIYERGFIDNSPLANLLTNLFVGREVKKRIIVSANDADSGAYIPM